MHFRARIVILDEPTTALAVGEVEKVLDFMRRVKEEGRSVMVITHSVEHAWRVADRFVVLSHGKIFGEWSREGLTAAGLLEKLIEAEQ